MLVPDRRGLGTDLVLDEIAKYPSGINIAGDSAKYLSAYEEGTSEERLYVQPRRGRAQFFNPPQK